MGLAQENKLSVAGEAPGEAVGKADGQSVRKHADAVGAAEAGRERRHRPAHDVHEGVARRHHPPGAFGVHLRRARLKAARVLDSRPGDAQRAEFRQGRELIGVGRQAEGDQGAGFGGRRARRLEQAQQADGGRERKGELLRRAPARRVNGARIGRHDRRAKAHASQSERALEMGRGLRSPVGRKRSAGRGRERIEAERHRAVRRPCARAFDQRGESERLARTVGTEIELETRPGVETHAIESLVKGRGIESLEAVAVAPERAGEHDLKTVRAIGEVVAAPGRWPRRGRDGRDAR